MNGSALTNFLGGSPASVALRLVVVSFVVGLFLVMFGFEPADIVASVARLAHRRSSSASPTCASSAAS